MRVVSPLSVGILARNEESLIAGCIEGLAPIAREVIVVDNGSTDDTAGIAASSGARVISAPDQVLDLARTAYVHAAQTDWLFVIDADERVLPQDLESLAELACSTQTNIAGYALPRYDYLGHGRWAKSRMLRLFRRHPIVRYGGGAIHGSPWRSVKAVGAIDITSEVPIHHFDVFSRGTKALKAKRARYAEGIRLQLSKRGNRADNYIAYLAAEMVVGGELDRALDLLTTVGRASAGPRSLLYLAQLQLIAGNLALARKYALMASERSGRFWEAAQRVLIDADHRCRNRDDARERAISVAARCPRSASAHINAAAFMKTQAERDQEIQRAIALNPLLSEARVFAPFDAPSLFSHQDSIVEAAEHVLVQIRENAVYTNILTSLGIAREDETY